MTNGIKSVTVEGVFDVQGVVNYNGVGMHLGHKNHRRAKQDRSGHDFTSSNCLRQAMFSEYVPRQPCSQELKDNFTSFMGSVPGLLRGGLEAGSGCKNKSPLTLLDAYTVLKQNEEGESRNVLFVEQCTTSKPKESGLKSTSAKKEGADASDTSMFTQDNAPHRHQKLKCVIRFRDMQLVEVGDSDAVVPKSGVKDLVEGLKTTFSTLGVDADNLTVSEHTLSTASIPTTTTGILLNDEQLRALTAEALRLLEGIEVYRKGAELVTNKESLHANVTFEDGTVQVLPVSDFKGMLKTATFQKFWA